MNVSFELHGICLCRHETALPDSAQLSRCLFLERIIRDYTSFVYAQQRSPAGSSEPTESEAAEPPPAKEAALVTSASSLFGHYSKDVVIN